MYEKFNSNSHFEDFRNEYFGTNKTGQSRGGREQLRKAMVDADSAAGYKIACKIGYNPEWKCYFCQC